MPVKHPCLLFVYLALLVSIVSADEMADRSAQGLEFSPPEWKYGMIDKGEVARTTIEVFNRGLEPLLVTFIPTCSCLSVSPAEFSIAAGTAAKFSLSFDSKDDEGKVSRGYIVKAGAQRVAGTAATSTAVTPLYYLLSGVVRSHNASAQAHPASSAASGFGSGIELRYYYTPGCRACEAFIAKGLPELASRDGIATNLVRRDLLDPKVYEELAAAAAELGTSVKAIPALRIGNTLLQGDQEIEARLPGLLIAAQGAQDQAAPSPAVIASPASVSRSVGASLAIVPVMLAGLVDGINPCAFTTLIFLLASLALAGRGRKEVLVIGALFTLGVFLTYLGVGFGLFAALRAASAISVVSLILRWLLFAILLAFAILSVYDYFKIRSGKASEMLLQLPNSLKLKIHASIRNRAKTAALAGSSLALGFLVSIFEFACTAQVYLPTLAYLARQKGRGDAIGLLVLYNLCFIAPLVVVFIASYLGVGSKKIATAFQKRMGAVKLGLAAVFIVLAALTLLS